MRGLSRKVDAVKNQPADIAELEHRLGYRFSRPGLLALAVTHRSFINDQSASHTRKQSNPEQDNEQLEFLGDAVLGMLVAESLCARFAQSNEGELTRMRASLVSRKHLGAVGTRLELGQWLRLGQSAEDNRARTNPGIFSNAVEAIIAALYLDGGIEPARRFIEDEILLPALPDLHLSLTEDRRSNGAVGDWKSTLQEMLQAEGLGTPDYRLAGEIDADSHDPERRIVTYEVWVRGAKSGTTASDTNEGSDRMPRPVARGSGPNKKEAQKEAARLAVERLRHEGLGVARREMEPLALAAQGVETFQPLKPQPANDKKTGRTPR